MIAEVYPLKRLSRKLSAFDYLIPNEYKISRGNLVEIPFRGKYLWGIVKRVKDIPERGIKLKTILSTSKLIHLRDEELTFFEWLASDSAVSVSTILYCAIQHPPKNSKLQNNETVNEYKPVTLPKSEANHIAEVVKRMRGRQKLFVQSPDIRRSVAAVIGYLQSNPPCKSLILVPTVRDATLIKERLSPKNIFLITGEDTAADRFTAWKRFRECKNGILIGTRGSALMIDSSVRCVFMLRSGDENFKQSKRNPRFNTCNVIWEMHNRFGANIFCFDFVVTSNVLDRFLESEIISSPTAEDVILIDQKNGKDIAALKYETVEMIKNAIENGGRILCVHNQKGVARMLFCKMCSYKFLCERCESPLLVAKNNLECKKCKIPEKFPALCPVCKSKRMISVGFGNEKVVKELFQNFPRNSIALIDKSHESANLNSQIIVTTDYYYENFFDPFNSPKLDLVIATCIDSPLFSNDPSSLTSAARELYKWKSLAWTNRAIFAVQTLNPNSILHLLQDPYRLACEEQSAKKEYNLPPTYRWSSIVVNEKNKLIAEHSVELLKNKLSKINGVIIKDTVEQNKICIDVGILAENFDELNSLFLTLPDKFVIDTTLFT
jgi:primosomal protein N'